MSQARVDSLEVLREFKVALWKFQEAAIASLSDADAEMQRVTMWVENEQTTHWQGQIRKRQDAVERAKEAVRMKKIFKDATGRQQSAVEEEKALRLAMQRLAEAQQKLAATKRWTRALQKEIELYRGGVQRFATTVHGDIPTAVAHLESLAAKLDAYVSLQAAGAGEGALQEAAASTVPEPSMARAAPVSQPPIDDEIGRLRQRIPAPAIRSAAPAAASVPEVFPPIPPEQPRAITRLGEAAKPPSDHSRILVARPISPGERLFLHRDDDGWVIAPTGAPQWSAWESVAAADLRRHRPELGDLLALLPGFSVIMDTGGVAAVYDPSGQAVWQR